jgi:hypothetical protein
MSSSQSKKSLSSANKTYLIVFIIALILALIVYSYCIMNKNKRRCPYCRRYDCNCEVCQGCGSNGCGGCGGGSDMFGGGRYF